jgi:allantoate deiminase
MRPLALESARVTAHLEALSEIGRSASAGVTRLGLTSENAAAKELVAGWMREAGLATRYDAAANLIGRLGPPGPAIVIASHLDSVLDGGRFDGPLGVLLGLEVARQLAPRQEQLSTALEVIAFSDEEGTRFGTGFFGSRAMLGELPPGILDRRDQAGVSIAQALEDLGYDPQEIGTAARQPGEIAAYLEVHVEQGAVLDQLGYPVGIVSGIAGPAHLLVTLTGRADHAGATPMHLRRDPLPAAADVILAAERLAVHISPSAVATVGMARVKPGAVNVIPGQVQFSLDVRDVHPATRDRLIQAILAHVEAVCAARQIEWTVEEHLRVDPVPLSPRMQAVLGEGCQAAGVPVHIMPSGAGHDAMVFAPYVDTGMLFVRSRGGVSHSPAEKTEEADIAVAAKVLWDAVVALAS